MSLAGKVVVITGATRGIGRAVAEKTAELLGDEPGRETGRVYSLLPLGQMLRGIAKMAWHGMTGKMERE